MTLEESARSENKNSQILRFKNTDLGAVSAHLNAVLTQEGYKQETGGDSSGIYGKGNKLMLVLLGAFANRFEYKFEISEENGLVELRFSKNKPSAALGGVIGMRKMGKEFDRLVELIEKA